MSATERLLAAIVDIQHYITHDIDPDKCAACPRWDELQGAAMGVVTEIERLRADLTEALAALHDSMSQACQAGDRGEYDSMALSAYSDALEVLDKHGLVEITANVGRRTIAIDAARGKS